MRLRIVKAVIRALVVICLFLMVIAPLPYLRVILASLACLPAVTSVIIRLLYVMHDYHRECGPEIAAMKKKR